MTNTVPIIEEWSKDLANENMLDKAIAADESQTETDIREIISLQGTDTNRQMRAAMIVAGKTPPPELRTPDLDSKMSHLGDIRLARKLSKDKVAETRRREGTRLCLELKPAFNAIAKRFADALVSAHTAALEMASLESQLKSQGIGFYPIVCNINTEKVIGWPTDKTSDFSRLLHECVAMKHLKSLPKELQ